MEVNINDESMASMLSLLQPKVLADKDGNCVVSATKLQDLLDFLQKVSMEADKVFFLSGQILSDIEKDKKVDAVQIFRVRESSRRVSNTVRSSYVKLKGMVPLEKSPDYCGDLFGLAFPLKKMRWADESSQFRRMRECGAEDTDKLEPTPTAGAGASAATDVVVPPVEEDLYA